MFEYRNRLNPGAGTRESLKRVRNSVLNSLAESLPLSFEQLRDEVRSGDDWQRVDAHIEVRIDGLWRDFLESAASPHAMGRTEELITAHRQQVVQVHGFRVHGARQGHDDDCDGDTDESNAADVTTWNIDEDGDSYGSTVLSSTACFAPEGYVADGTDCDDSDADTNPGATDYCEGEDDD